MTEAEKQRLDRIASQHQGPRSRTQNLNRHFDNLEEFGAIGKPVATPATCTRCGGAHSLSRCPWPACQKDFSNNATPGG